MQTSSDLLMVFDHIGIVNTEEDMAVKFYRNILGLHKIRDSVIPAELAEQLFSCANEIKMLVFGNEKVKIEVFILPNVRPPSPNIGHFCFLVPDLPGFLRRAEQSGVRVTTGSLPGKTVHFIEDFSGNRIEIKQG